MTRRGIGPGDPGYVQLQAWEANVKRWLRKSPPNPLLEDLARWRLHQMKEAIEIGDWEGVTGMCQQLVRLIAVMTR
jgi:hypothetical protein